MSIRRGAAWFNLFRNGPAAGWRSDAASLIFLSLMVALIGCLFALPWLPSPPTGGEELHRYLPFDAGRSNLVATLDENGTPTRWSSSSIRSLPRLSMFNDLRFAPSAAVIDALSINGSSMEQALDAIRTTATALALNRRELGSDGAVTELVELYVRDERGVMLVGWEQPEGHGGTFFKPPILLFPPDLNVGREWASEGVVQSTPYRWSARVVRNGPYSGAAGEFDDCIDVVTTLAFGDGAAATGSLETLCAGLGIVESRDMDANGVVTARQVLAAAVGLEPVTNLLPPPAGGADSSTATVSVPIDTWTVTRVGQMRASAAAGLTTTPPAWAAGNPPQVFTGDQSSELMAFDARDVGAPVRWRMNLGGSAYGAPAVDVTRGRLYVGSNAKRVYGLDTRGMFLWSAATHDNVVATPLIANDLVIVACEDRVVYALDANNGSIRWTFDATGPIVSAPALMGDTVIVGADDQTVYGLDLENGSVRWVAPTSGAVEGPITTTESLALVPGRDGSVSAIDPTACTQVSCEAVWSTTLGDPIRSAVIAIGSDGYVVDEMGFLSALDLSTGQRQWTIGRSYVGPPATMNGRLFVATREGELHEVGWNGRVEAHWSLTDARGPIDPTPEVVTGLISADGAIWLADRRATLWRLGPPLGSNVPGQLRSRWTVERSNLRGEADRFINTPVPYGSMLALVDSLGQVQQVDPATGEREITSRLPGNDLLSPIDPTIVGDRLVAVVGTSLVSSGLQHGMEPWSAGSEGVTNNPPATDGDSLYWISGAAEPDASVLRALRASDGLELWSQPLKPTFSASGAIVDAGAVYVSGPPSAFDAATGRQIWEAAIPGPGLGRPVLDKAHGRVFIGYTNPSRGGVAALDARTGALVWTASLPEGVLSIFETLWLSPTTLIVPSFTGSITGLDPQNGALRWRYQSPGSRLGNVTVANGQVWMMQENGQIFVVDAESGALTARLTSQDVNVGSPRYRQRVHVDEHGAVAAMTHLLLGLELPR